MHAAKKTLCFFSLMKTDGKLKCRQGRVTPFCVNHNILHSALLSTLLSSEGVDYILKPDGLGHYPGYTDHLHTCPDLSLVNLSHVHDPWLFSTNDQSMSQPAH